MATRGLTVQALEMACNAVECSCCSINRITGVSYVATACQQRLTTYGIHCSVTLKTELVYVRRFQTLQDARWRHLEGFYNRQDWSYTESAKSGKDHSFSR